MPLGEMRTCDRILQRGQRLVADKLVERHAAGARPTRIEHPRSEHRVGRVVFDRRDELRKTLGGVLPIPVEQHHDVELVGDRPAIAQLLIPAVAEVLGRAQDGQREVRELLVTKTNEVRVVLAVIVADENARDSLPEVERNPIEHLRQGRGRVVSNYHDADALHDCKRTNRERLPSAPSPATWPLVTSPG